MGRMNSLTAMPLKMCSLHFIHSFGDGYVSGANIFHDIAFLPILHLIPKFIQDTVRCENPLCKDIHTSVLKGSV